MSQNQNGISSHFSSRNSSPKCFYWIGSLLLHLPQFQLLGTSIRCPLLLAVSAYALLVVRWKLLYLESLVATDGWADYLLPVSPLLYMMIRNSLLNSFPEILAQQLKMGATNLLLVEVQRCWISSLVRKLMVHDVIWYTVGDLVWKEVAHHAWAISWNFDQLMSYILKSLNVILEVFGKSAFVVAPSAPVDSPEVLQPHVLGDSGVTVVLGW